MFHISIEEAKSNTGINLIFPDEKTYDYFSLHRFRILKWPLIFILVWYAVVILSFVFDMPFLLKAFFIIFSIPWTLVFILFLVVLIRFSGRELNGKIRTVISIEKKFIIANFKLKNQRVRRIFAYLNDAGTKFSVGDGEYAVDLKAIYYDDFDYPNADYVFGLPNPIVYDYQEAFDKWIDEHKQNLDRRAQGMPSIPYTSNVSFNSKSLKMLNEQTIGNAIMGLMGKKNDKSIPIIAMAIIGFVAIIIVVFLMKNPQVATQATNIVQNITQPIAQPAIKTIVVT